MDLLTLDELKSLAGDHPVCLSLFMPTQRGGVEAFQNPVRLRNLVVKAEQELAKHGYDAAAISDLLEPARSLAEDVSFWEHPGEGLALFLAPGLFRRYRLPLAFQETAAVGPHFLIRPLLPLLSGDGRFYVLALSQNAVRLLEGTRDSVLEVALEGVPHSLTEALRYEEPQARQNVNYNAGRPFPGNNEPKEDRKEQLARFFHLVDQALPTAVRDGSDPLVLAGVDYEQAIYRQVTACPHLIEEGLAGNPERLSMEALHERAWEIVQPDLQQAQRQAMTRFTESIGTGLASEDACEIVAAARFGRVDSLAVAEGGPVVYGRFDPDANRAEAHAEAEASDEDLVNLAMIETLLNGGAIYADTVEIGPHARPMAAVFRY